MHFYRVVIEGLDADRKPQFAYKQDDAHKIAKAEQKHVWPYLRVELVDVPVTSERLARILNGDLDGLVILRTWRITDRGGLAECPNGE